MKKVFALFLALLMVVSCMVILPVAAEDATEIKPWDGTKTTPEGTGREKDPYIIDSAGDIAWLAGFIADQRLSRLGRDGKQYYAQYASDPLFTDVGISLNEAGEYIGNTAFEQNYKKKYAAYHLPMVATDGSKMDWFEKIYVKQVCDIDCGGKELAPIGNYWSNTQGAQAVKGTFFCGEYDGQGYTIRNGKFKPTGTNANWVSGSMFGVVWGSTIKNLNFENMSGSMKNAMGSWKDAKDASKGTTGQNNSTSFGLVVGRAVTFAMFGSKENIAEYDKIENAKTVIDNVNVGDNCTVYANGTFTNVNVGGIIGEMSNTTVKNCISAAVIVANPEKDTLVKPGTGVDGIPAQYAGRDDRARALYTGGIVGVMWDDAWVENCIFAGHVSYQSPIKAESHIGGIAGSWRGVSVQTVDMGKTGIVDCVNLGSFYFKKNDSTLCFSGILGGTSCLYSNGTESTYVFDHNVNLSDAHNASGTRRMGAVVGVFYNNAKCSARYSKAARYNKVEVTNCFAVADFAPTGVGSYSDANASYPLHPSGLFTSGNKKSNGEMAKEGEGNIYYTRGDHFRALASETPYHYTDANADMAALDAYAVALYTRYYDIVNDFLFDGAAGTAEDPYKVNSLADLMWMSAHTGSALNGGTQRLFRASWAGKNFVQTADIDLQGTGIWPMGTYVDRGLSLYDEEKAEKPDTPLGSGDQQTIIGKYRNLKLNAFGGYYNGQGWSIKNGTLMDTASTNNNWAAGLFGVLYGATIKNVTLDNITTMQNNNAGFIAGMSLAKEYSDVAPYQTIDAAPVANQPYSDTFNVIDGCRVINSTMTVGGGCTSASYGAIIGAAHSVTIRNCYTENVLINTNGDDRTVYSMGGIAGRVEAAVKIENCISGTNLRFRTGDAKNTNESGFGGIVGSAPISTAAPAYTNGAVNTTSGVYFSMKNCVNTGSFELIGTKTGNHMSYGGLIGATTGIVDTAKGVQVVNCFNLNDEIIVPAGYNFNGFDFRVGALMGCYWLASGNPAADEVEFINCGSVALPTVCYAANAAYVNEKGETITGKMNAFSYRGDRKTANNLFPILAVNSSEVPMFAQTEKELDTLNALVVEILNEMTKGVGAAIPVGGAAEVDDRDRLTVTFYAAIDEDVKKYDVVNVVYEIAMIEDGKVSNYTMNFDGFVTNATAPAGYNLVTEYSLPVGKKADATLDFVYSVTVYTADGAVRNGYVAGAFTVVNGVVAD